MGYALCLDKKIITRNLRTVIEALFSDVQRLNDFPQV